VLKNFCRVAHLQFVDDRAVRTIVAMATRREVFEGPTHLVELAFLAFQFGRSGKRHRFDSPLAGIGLRRNDATVHLWQQAGGPIPVASRNNLPFIHL
jgi:hypothetical protein